MFGWIVDGVKYFVGYVGCLIGVPIGIVLFLLAVTYVSKLIHIVMDALHGVGL
jgi:hypothetical protein